MFLWSVGNEVGEQNTGEEGAAVVRELIDIAHQEDATRPATASMNSAKPSSPFAAAVDAITLNYQGEGIRDSPAFAHFRGIRTPPQYPAFREKFGELKVAAYKNGKGWATDTVKTAEAPARLALLADRSTIRADGADLCFIVVRVVDAGAITVPRANDHIKFTIAGPGEIVATDNGDPTSFETFPAAERKAFNGQAMVIVRSFAGRTGTIRLSALSGALQGGSVTLQSVAASR